MVFVTYFWEFSKIMGRKIKETIQIMSYLNPSGVFLACFNGIRTSY